MIKGFSFGRREKTVHYYYMVIITKKKGNAWE